MAVELHNVSKRYRIHRERARSFHELIAEGFRPWRQRSQEDVWALQDINMMVPQGETLGIIGPNGAGKSTILKLIARVLEPTSGQITTHGRVSPLLELGTGFHPDLTGRENVFLYGSLLGLSRRDMTRRFASIVAFSGVGEVIDVPVKRYSSGMYLRLAFSVAIHVEPDVLLVDEVFAVGDHVYQDQCLRRIRELQRQGVTILFVSHSMGTVKQMCSRAVWIAHGCIVAGGAPEQVVEQYLSQAMPRSGAKLSQEPDIPGVHWGTGEAEIVRASFLDSEGKACRSVPSGGALHVRIEFVAHQRIERPVFGLAIYRNDGTHVNGPNTQLAGLPIEYIDGPGTVEYRIERIPLLPGGYTLSAAIYNWEGLHAYDHWHQAFPFVIEPGETNEVYGLVQMPARWRFASGGVEVEQRTG
jgi:ABC-type polysaccharide/polyol phosphate transport system ATPase subunit